MRPCNRSIVIVSLIHDTSSILKTEHNGSAPLRYAQISSEGKDKGKVVPALNSLSATPWRRIGSGCIDPCYLDLGISLRWVGTSAGKKMYIGIAPLRQSSNLKRHYVVGLVSGREAEIGRKQPGNHKTGIFQLLYSQIIPHMTAVCHKPEKA
jgi:hypothetical protein